MNFLSYQSDQPQKSLFRVEWTKKTKSIFFFFVTIKNIVAVHECQAVIGPLGESWQTREKGCHLGIR